jgi:drug/metabolite transporter (DMT)-like permease
MLVTTSPIFAAVLAWAVLREGIGKKTLVAIALCIVGSVIIGRRGVEMGPENLKGNVLAILGAAAFGGQFVIARSLRRKMGFLEYVFTTYTAAAVVLIGFALARGHDFVGFERINYLWLFLLALGPQVFGHSTLNWAIRYLPAPKVAVSVLGEPIGSALLAWVFFSELPGYGLFIGGALILYGVYLALTEATTA